MIDLDQNATTPLAPEALEAMRPYWSRGGNPESRHGLGRSARRGWDQARETVAEVLHADPAEVVFTSGGTEANHLALLGLARPESGPGQLVSSPLEHPAVAGPLARLGAIGFDITIAPARPDGTVNLFEMGRLIRPDTRLATLMLAQNETGVIQPVARLAESAWEHGVPIHTDAVQAVGRIPVDFRALGVATLAASAHKFHGPPGVGLLLIRKGVALAPQWHGGGQQGGLRPGTPPVALAVGLAEALRLWHDRSKERIDRWERLRDRLQAGLLAALGPERVVVHGPTDNELRLPQTLHVGFPGLNGELLLMRLDLAGLAVSLGSACASGSLTPSSALIAMGLPVDQLRSSVRFSFGASTTEDEIETALRVVVGVVRHLGTDTV